MLPRLRMSAVSSKMATWLWSRFLGQLFGSRNFEMFVEQIERMKRQYTDKYVMVDAARPELARFRDVVGRVKTVNMNGQALVEFDDYHLNTGWYDIAPEFLKVVDKPPPKAPKPEVKKAPAKAEAKPAAAAKPQAAKAPAAEAKAGKASVADILAAARGGKAPAPAAEKQPPSAPPKPPAAAKPDRSNMSVAEMLAAARAGSAAGLVPAKAKSEAAPAAAQVEETPAKEPAAEAPPAAAAAPSGKTVTRVDKSGMSIDDILAYCREHDAK